MKQLFQSLFNIGIDPNTDQFNIRTIQLVNTLALITSLILLLMTPVLLLSRVGNPILLNGMMIFSSLAIAMGLVINGLKRYLMAKIYTMLMIVAVISVLSFLKRGANINHLALCIPAILVYFCFTYRERRYAYGMVMIISVLFCLLEYRFLSESSLSLIHI